MMYLVVQEPNGGGMGGGMVVVGRDGEPCCRRLGLHAFRPSDVVASQGGAGCRRPAFNCQSGWLPNTPREGNAGSLWVESGKESAR